MTEPVLDIMVPAHGKLDMTIQCVESIYQGTKNPFHLIITDDSSVSKPGSSAPKPVDEWDATKEYFERFAHAHKNCTYVHSDVPYKNGNQFFNVAIAHMKTPYLATVMNSMRVDPNWDDRAIQMMTEDPKIGVIGFKCLFPNGKIECAGIQLFDGYMPIDMGRDLPGHFLTEIYEVPAIQWAFALLRKEAVEGNLTEEVFYGHKGWDDIDNCFVVKSKGYKIMYCGFGSGTHYPRATRGDNSRDGYLKNKANAKAFWKRWGLWENYLGSKKLDISEKLSNETKKNLTAVHGEWLICKDMIDRAQLLLNSRVQVLQAIVKKAMVDELKVDPEQYSMAVDPPRDTWDLKLRADMLAQEAAEKDDLEAQMKARREAIAGSTMGVSLKDDSTPEASMVAGES